MAIQPQAISDHSSLREERARRTWKEKRRASLRHVRRKTTPRPLLHPEVKKMMEGFFEHVKSTDPDQQAVTACYTGCNRK